MYCSSIASRNGRLLVRLDIRSTDRMAKLFLSLNASVPTKNPVVSQLLHIQKTSRPVVGVLIVQTPHSCLQDLLPTSTYQSYLFLFAYLQASCRSSHLSKHLTCVSRTHSQPQPVEIYSRCSSPGKLSEFSLSKHLTCVSRTYSQLQPVEILQAFQKHIVSGNQLTSHFHQMT